MPRSFQKQNSSARPCGCAKKGPHNQKICSRLNEDNDDDNNRGRYKISKARKKQGTGRLNLSNLRAKAKSTSDNIKVSDDELQALMLHQAQDQSNIWSLNDDAPHNTVAAYVFSQESKSGDIAFFNRLNEPAISDGQTFYMTRNGGLGVNAEALTDGFSEGDMVGLIIVDLGNYYDLIDDDDES